MIGFMGVGKTTIGKELAEKLSREFIDVDELIEEKFKMPTTEIFKTYGENTFREIEKNLIAEYSKKPRNILSVGGGAFLQEGIRNICMTNCIVIFLELSWDLWKERIPLILETRPVLQGKSMEEIEELFYKRQESYSIHHLKVFSDHLTPEEAAERIIKSLELE